MLTVILNILPYIQILLAILMVILILIQQTDSDAGGSFGGGGAGGNFHTRRGAEKFIFYFTIVISVLFVASVLVDLWK
jgi:protein translocase SecG subunit